MNKLLFNIITLSYLLQACSFSDKSPLSDEFDEVNSIRNELDSIQIEINNRDSVIKILAIQNPGVLIDTLKDLSIPLIMYKNFGLNLQVQNIRPEKNTENFLSVPAAYTNRENKIDGLFIKDGVFISQIKNLNLNGACIISKNDVNIFSIEHLDSNLILKIISEKSNLFQQTLLIKNGNEVECNLFGKNKSKRRSLAQLNNKFVIIESITPCEIAEFQKILIEIGIHNAINLDMGSWSEGWYKDKFGNVIRIGESFINTNKQTNWITLSLK